MASLRTVLGSAFACISLAIAFTGPARADEPPLKLQGLDAKVEVFFDNHGIPHVYAQSRTDANRVLGYLHAVDRLGEMDLFRRQASGTMAEIRGKEALKDDILVRRLGLRRSCEALRASADLPSELKAELQAYADGVNQRINELSAANLPLVCKALGYKPAPWTPVDSLVFSKYMGWDQSGTDDDLWCGLVVEKLGASTFEQLWPLERPYEIPTVAAQYDRGKVTQAPLHPIPGAGEAYAAALKSMNWQRWLGEAGCFGSNNWAVDGTKTVSGKPILCSDPHLGFRLPSIWYACHLCVGGKNIVGVTFPGGPAVVIGHTDHHAWGLTNMQTDAVDYYVETVDPKEPLRYRHRGQWKQMERITERIPVKGAEAYELHIDSTVHGPVISREGKTITMAWTGLGPTRDPIAIWRMNQATSLKEFLEALDNLEVPALNVCYADIEGNIAMHPCGRLPLRLPGQGRIPMDGASGEDDWNGWIPRNELPLEVNPARHFVASANNRPAPLGYPHYLGWMWDPNYRIRRIHELLGPAKQLTIERMGSFQYDALDKAAQRFVPRLLQALKKHPPQDAFAHKVQDALAQWDFVALPEATGPVIWLRWFETYRDAVWKPHMAGMGLDKEGGWGFNGGNRRDPVIEVLEYLTLEQPHSRWFDNPATPEREDADTLMVRAFHQAVTSLKTQFGDDLDKWRWKNINRLEIPSLLGEKMLARSGGPVPGTDFTVNPGSNIGTVGGGASWRMVVDFGDSATSVGVYPGGQSENPFGRLYSDQMKLWAQGRYLPLHAVGDSAKLPEAAKARTLVFAPSAGADKPMKETRMKTDAEKLQGAWNVATLEVDGTAMAAAVVQGSKIVIQGERFTTVSMGATYKGTFKIDATKSPKTLDLRFTEGPEKGNTALGIYELDGDAWKLCLSVTAKTRPKEFTTKAGSGYALETLVREVPGKKRAAAESPAPDRGAPKPEKVAGELEGEWSMVSGEIEGRKLPEAYVKTGKRIVKGNLTTVTINGQTMMKATFTVDATKKPKTIDFTMVGGFSKGAQQLGIYELDGDTFRSCFASPGKERPTDFSTSAGDGRTFSVWKKVKR
jgi:penicillin amidase